MDELDIFIRLGVALAIGLLLGLERGWKGRADREGARVAGIRTFALTALLGGITGWLVTFTAPVVLGLATLGLAMVIAAGYWANLRAGADVGMTTEIAMLLAFALGAAAVLGPVVPAAAVAVVAALILSLKSRLHGWVAAIDRLELAALFQLAVISVVVLPLLPDAGYGPGGALNPYALWWAVVVVAGLSFFGYVAIRLAGADFGVLLTGAFGGLASSTATTLTLARLVRGQAGLVGIGAAGIVLAAAVTFLRILVLAAIFAPALVGLLAAPMGAMAVAGAAGAIALRAGARPEAARPGEGAIDAPRNPLALHTALGFGLVLVVVAVGLVWLRDWLGDTGLYAAAAMAGITDVDALTISVSRMTAGDLSDLSAARAIVLAVMVNTIVKGVIAAVVGGRALAIRVVPVHALVLVAGGAAMALA